MSFESGSEHPISSQSITFYEVDHWTESHEKKTTRTQNFWDGIKNQCELEDHPIPFEDCKLANEKWIYVYTKQSWGYTISHEIKVSSVDSKQKFDIIDWVSDHKFVAGKKRPFNKKEKSTFKLNRSKDYALLLSEIQLSHERIEFYRKNKEMLELRSSSILASASESSPFKKVYLVNPIIVAEYYFPKAEAALKIKFDHLQDGENAQKRSIAEYTNAIIKNTPKKNGLKQKVSSWVNKSKLKTYLDSENKKIKEKDKKAETLCYQFFNWKKSKLYNLTLADYFDTTLKEAEEKKEKLLESQIQHGTIALLTIHGANYLKSLVKNDNIFKAILDSQPYKLTSTVIKLAENDYLAKIFWLFETGKVLSKSYTLKINISAKKITSIQEMVIKDIKTFQKNHENLFAELSEFKISKKTQRIEYQIDSLKVIETTTEKSTYISKLNKFKNGLTYLVGVIELANLVATVNFSERGKNIQERIDNDLSFASALAGTCSALESIWGLFYSISSKILQRVLFVVGIIGSLLDIISNLRNGLKAYKKGNKEQAIGFFTSMVAAAMLGVGSTALSAISLGLITGGAATVWSGIGLLLLIVGAILAFAGAIILWFTSTTEIERWMTESYFGKRPKRYWSLKDQFVNIQEILALFDVEFKIYQFYDDRKYFNPKSHRITVKPNHFFITCEIKLGLFIPKKSSMHINYKVKANTEFFEDGDKVIIQKYNPKLMANNADVQTISKGDVIEKLVWVCHLTGSNLKSKTSNEHFYFKCKMRLDLNGDEEILIPKEGVLERDGYIVKENVIKIGVPYAGEDRKTFDHNGIKFNAEILKLIFNTPSSH